MSSEKKSVMLRKERYFLRSHSDSQSSRESHSASKREASALEDQTPKQQSLSSSRIRYALRSAVAPYMSVRTPVRRGHSTPYKTPRLTTIPWHRIETRTSVKKRDAKLWNEDIKRLLNKSMKLCNVSSMINFKYKDEKRRAIYAKTLKSKVLEVFPSPVVTVKFTVNSCLSWHSSTVDAVCLEVASLVPGNNADEDKWVVVYNAWLIHTKHTQSKNVQSVNWMPLMLYTGRELIHQVFVEWLQGSFGCYVTRCGMLQSDLLWMAGICCRRKCNSSSHKQEDNRIELTYSIIPPCGTSNYSPPNHRSKPKLVIRLLSKDIHEVWNRLVDDSQINISLEDLQMYLSAIDSVTSRISGLPSSLLRLQQIRTSCVLISSIGKVRLICRRSMGLIIHGFMDIFLQRTSSYNQNDFMEDLEEEDTIAELNNNYQ